MSDQPPPAVSMNADVLSSASVVAQSTADSGRVGNIGQELAVLVADYSGNQR